MDYNYEIKQRKEKELINGIETDKSIDLLYYNTCD